MKKHPFVMPKLAPEALGATVQQRLEIAGVVFDILLPASADALLDLASTAQAFDVDEYLPYWATLWPVSSFLAKWVLGQAWPPGRSALELGCGLGICGLAALAAGLDVLFSDYDQTALSFVEENAKRNGWPAAKTVALDWRHPLPQTFDVILASDVLYERRALAPVVGVLTAMLAPGGVALIADPNRPYARDFCQALTAAGFAYTAEEGSCPHVSGQAGLATLYRIQRA